LPELAEAAPGIFLRELWPWFTRLLGHILETRERKATGYRRDVSLATNMSSHHADMGLDFITDALRTAVQGLACQDPAQFLAFVQAQEQNDGLFVQRLLCRGLRTIAATHPAEGLRF